MKAKKSLGQNFLNSKAVAKDIVHAAELSSADTVLEIGPGKGFLTAELLATGAQVIAIEKDDALIPLLSEKFSDAIAQGRLILIHKDILETDLAAQDLPKHYKLVANIPYYITGQILRMFLEATMKPECMILMVQKEVADRIVARDKKESILSIAVKAYGTPKLIKKVPARYFTPTPKVDSAILAITDISNKHFKTPNDAEYFFKIVKTGFAHKRKKLAGNLRELFGEQTLAHLADAGIDPNARAENIAIAEWLSLASKTA